MSRIGNMPIDIPDGVEVAVDGAQVRVKGPKGELRKEMHEDMVIEVNENQVNVSRPSESKEHKSLHGLTRSLVANMIDGVTKGFEKTLDIRGVGYRAALQGKKLVLTVGYSHPVEMDAPDGIDFEVPAPTRIAVRGIDKQLVGAVAANVRSVREPEPYLGKGIMYTNERIRRKAGKAGKVTG